MINAICEKLISRHPHIYGDVQVKDDEEVKQNWEKLKLKEGKKSVLSGVPLSLPAMVKAMRLQEKASQVGFDWDKKEQVWEKVEEEKGELLSAIDSWQSAMRNPPATGLNGEIEQRKNEVEEEFGDLVFSLVNYARFLQVDAENALEKTNKKFIYRFTQMEQQALQQGKDLQTMTLSEMVAIWNAIKQQREH